MTRWSHLGDAAWTLLATHPVDQIDFDAVADMAGVDRGLAGRLLAVFSVLFWLR